MKYKNHLIQTTIIIKLKLIKLYIYLGSDVKHFFNSNVSKKYLDKFFL